MTGDLVLICIFISLVAAVALYVAELRISKLKEEFDLNLSTMQGEVNYLESRVEHLDCVVVTLESRMDEDAAILADFASSPEEYEVHVPTAFDVRIAQFREDLNTPTYEREQEPSYHPGVYDVPHDSVQDVPIKFEPEYAD